MAYTPFGDWENDAPPGLTAERMTTIEEGIQDAAATADDALEQVGDVLKSSDVKRIIVSSDPEETLQEGDLLLVHEPKTQFFTDFSEYNTGEAPSDWSSQWVTPSSVQVQESQDASSGYVLRMVLPSSTSRVFYSWDSLGQVENVEMYGRYRIVSGGDDPSFVHPGLCVRGSGSQGTEQGYRGFRYRYQDVARCSVQGYEDGPEDYGQSFITTDEVANFSVSGWHSIRVRVYAGMIYAKAWKSDFNSEPADWQTSHPAANLATGKLGIGGLNSCTVEWEGIGVGINGYPAPTGAV